MTDWKEIPKTPLGGRPLRRKHVRLFRLSRGRDEGGTANSTSFGLWISEDLVTSTRATVVVDRHDRVGVRMGPDEAVKLQNRGRAFVLPLRGLAVSLLPLGPCDLVTHREGDVLVIDGSVEGGE